MPADRWKTPSFQRPRSMVSASSSDACLRDQALLINRFAMIRVSFSFSSRRDIPGPGLMRHPGELAGITQRPGQIERFQHVHDLLRRLHGVSLGGGGASAPLTAPQEGLQQRDATRQTESCRADLMTAFGQFSSRPPDGFSWRLLIPFDTLAEMPILPLTKLVIKIGAHGSGIHAGASKCDRISSRFQLDVFRVQSRRTCLRTRCRSNRTCRIAGIHDRLTLKIGKGVYVGTVTWTGGQVVIETMRGPERNSTRVPEETFLHGRVA